MTRHVRRWAVAAGALAAFAVGILLAVLLFSGTGGDGAPKPLPARPAPAPAAARPTPKPDRAATLARSLPAADAVAQLFAIGVRGTAPSPRLMRTVRRHAWGGVVLTDANWS